MRHRTNRYTDNCAKCKTSVEPEKGTLQGPPWKILCQTCLPFPASASTAKRIALRLVNAVILVVLLDRLNGLFSSYRTACSGLTKSRKIEGGWETTCPLDSAPELIERLSAIDGIRVISEPDVQAALQARASTRKADVEAANERMKAIDTKLAERGQALFNYQRTGIPWLSARDRAILADDMGLGKTLQALLSAPAAAPILVICPAVAKGVWVRETKKWRPDLAPVTLKGRKSFRWPVHGEIVITNSAILPGEAQRDSHGKVKAGAADLPAELVESCPEGVVIIADEAHEFKNSKSQRSTKFRALAELARQRGGRSWLLTATPLLNRPTELWALLTAGGMTEIYGSWARFCDAFGGYRGRFGFEWGTTKPDAAETLKRVQLRRLKKDVLTDLPPKRYQVVKLKLNKATKKACDEALAALDGFTDATKLAAATERDGVSFKQLSRARAALATAKTPHLLDLAELHEDANEPLVVFSAHIAPLRALAERDGWALITGETPAEKRTEIEDRFQKGKLKGVAASIKAGGVAITLTHASNAIFVDRLFTPALNEQAEDRIHRVGTASAVLITDLVAAHALDERLQEILNKKTALINGSINKTTRQANETDDTDLESAVSAALAALTSQADDPEGLDDASFQAALDALNAELATRAVETKWTEIVEQRASTRGIKLTEPKSDGEPRPRYQARNACECWAAEGLIILAQLDPDRARAKNNLGFNKADGWLGHQLAGRVSHGLTNLEWALAIGLLKKYHRQIGECPVGVTL